MSTPNVTLRKDAFDGKQFPCPLCGGNLPLRTAKTGKPYCHCDPCGLQLFVRGRTGIAKLKRLLDSSVLTGGSSSATVLFNTLQQLKLQKEKLEDRQSLIFRDADLDRTVEKIDSEIEAVRNKLAKL